MNNFIHISVTLHTQKSDSLKRLNVCVFLTFPLDFDIVNLDLLTDNFQSQFWKLSFTYIR